MTLDEKRARDAEDILQRDLTQLPDRIDEVARLLDKREISLRYRAPGEAWHTMLTLIAHKIVENARSVLELSGRGDCGLIARSMLESIAYLRHANEDRNSLPLRWMEYDAVQQVRECRERLLFEGGSGREADLAETRELLRVGQAELERVGHRFIDSKKAAEAKRRGEVDADVYVSSWHAGPVSQLIAKYQGPAALFLYRRLSETHHVRARHFAKAWRPETGRLDFNRVEWRAPAVNIALTSLNAILFLLDPGDPRFEGGNV